mgnify:CR=1 FL=1
MHAAVYAGIDPPVVTAGTQVIRHEGWYQLINPTVKGGAVNEVVLSLLKEGDVDKKVDETIALYRQHQLSFTWCIGPMSSPKKLEEKISALATSSWEFSGMAIDCNSDIATSNALQTEVVDSHNFVDFLSVTTEGWDLKDRTSTEERLKRMVTHPQYRCFIARNGDQVIGSAATILKEGHGYLIGGVVLKDYRGKGAYRSLIQARVEDLQRTGYPFAVTQARSATAVPILEKLGFQNLFSARIYCLA